MKGSKQRLLAVASAALGAASLAAVSLAPGSQSRSLAGGTYRVGFEAFYGTSPLAGSFDPTMDAVVRLTGQGGRDEFNFAVWGIYSNLLLRTLVGYNHVSGAAGTKLVPDLAVSVPASENGARTFRFRLKRGVKFGPPVRREITSKDIRYAIQRLARPQNRSVVASAFDVIRGFGAYRTGKARSISGIVTPSEKTIVFNLNRAAADFPHRLTLPATAPIPPEVGRCFEGKPGAYGRDLISSGPYMISGADAIRIGSCAAIRPMQGMSDTQLTLVRNPSYNRRTDSRAARENNPDRFVFVVGGKSVEIAKKLSAGELEDAVLLSSPKVLGTHMTSADKQGRLKVNSLGEILWIGLNLTRPPFDDVHVRKAMSLVMNKAAFRDEYGGPLAGPIAHHIIPDYLLDDRLKSFVPFKTPGDQGHLAKARAEMAKSKYATRRGICTAKACKGVHMKTNGPYAPGQRIVPLVRANAAEIGIALISRGRREDMPASNNAILVNAQFQSIIADPSNLIEPLFSGARIVPAGNFNYSLVGIRPAQTRRLGVKGRVRGVPSVDVDIARCSALAGAAGVGCYARLDRKLSTRIVPWIPFLWRNRINILGPQVAKWAFDQSTGMTAYAHVAVKR